MHALVETGLVVVFFLAATAGATAIHESTHADICQRVGGIAVTAYSIVPASGETRCSSMAGSGIQATNELVGMAALAGITGATLLLLLGVHARAQRASAS